MSKVLKTFTGTIGDFHKPNWYHCWGWLTDSNDNVYKIYGGRYSEDAFSAGDNVTFNKRSCGKKAFNVKLA